ILSNNCEDEKLSALKIRFEKSSRDFYRTGCYPSLKYDSSGVDRRMVNSVRYINKETTLSIITESDRNNFRF
ncbi:MAG: hypothetical protein AAFW70_29500, partial [Cyanobacteria bacterium J06635_10]